MFVISARMLLFSAFVTTSASEASGEACLPLDVITLLKSETVDTVAFTCKAEIQDGASCSSECHDALIQLQAVQTRHPTIFPLYPGLRLWLAHRRTATSICRSLSICSPASR